jgi:hypothetical protein
VSNFCFAEKPTFLNVFYPDRFELFPTKKKEFRRRRCPLSSLIFVSACSLSYAAPKVKVRAIFFPLPILLSFFKYLISFITFTFLCLRRNLSSDLYSKIFLRTSYDQYLARGALLIKGRGIFRLAFLSLGTPVIRMIVRLS